MTPTPRSTVPCRHCREQTALYAARARRGLCGDCWGHRGVRALYPAGEVCKHCRRCKAGPHHRGLCDTCYLRGEVRRRYPRHAKPPARHAKGPCRHCGRPVSEAVLAKRAGLCNGCRRDPALALRYGIRARPAAYEPTAAEIAAACALVQAGWTERDEWLRRSRHEPAVAVRECRVLSGGAG